MPRAEGRSIADGLEVKSGKSRTIRLRFGNCTGWGWVHRCLVCDYCTCCEPIHVLTAIPHSRSAPVKRRVPHGAGAPHAARTAAATTTTAHSHTRAWLAHAELGPIAHWVNAATNTNTHAEQNSAACRQVLPVDRHASATHYFQRGIACLAQPLRLIEQPHGFGLEHASYHISSHRVAHQR